MAERRPDGPANRAAAAALALSIAVFGLTLAVRHRAADAIDVSPAAAAGTGLRPVSTFDGIADPAARSAAIFTEAGKVIQSPRCLNCHPVTGRPTQTDAMTPHQPLVLRGPDGKGPRGGLHCNTCHQDANVAASGVPGNPKWSLAPAAMAWQGRSLAQICAQIKDRRRNGGRDLDAIIAHVSGDDLVGWAWHPGGNRTPAPGTQHAFGQLIAAWAASGAACPV